MIDPGKAYDLIGSIYKEMAAQEVQESALSTNRPWIVASKTKIKRDAPDHLPIEGDEPETYASLTRRTLSNVAEMMLVRRARMRGLATKQDELAVRRDAVLREIDVPPIEVAFIFGYTSDKPVRELRIRRGLDEHSGRPLKDSQRPIISDRKRARR